jgi:hypothetical protein
MEETEFENCKNLIYKLALKEFDRNCVKRPDVEFDDLLSEGYLIYSWCLKNYDSTKNTKFTTYLYIQLRGKLHDFYNFAFRKLDLYDDSTTKDGDSYVENITAKDYNINDDDLLDRAKEELSYEAKQVFDYIYSFEWKVNNNTKPSKAQISRHFHYPLYVVDSIMAELKMFWNKAA